MRILSQDGTELVNFKNCDSLTLEGKVVVTTFLDGYKVLGDYSTEKRAKEVLFEIAQHKESLYVMPEV